MNKKIILASASPRRKELLGQITLPFSVCISSCEEKIGSTVPAEVVCELSRQKAEDVWQGLTDGRMQVEAGGSYEKTPAIEELLVIGADTVVASGDRILGKPRDEKEACDMLAALSGRTHEVYTGVTFCYQCGGEKKVHTFFEETSVTFFAMSREEIADYVATGDPLDKAGAYGIQGRCAAYIKEIKGDYNNVVGLPVGRLYQELKECQCI